MGHIYEAWNLILDIIGPRDEWPRYMPPLFWKGRPLHNEERFKVTLFAYINGLSYDLLKEWCQLLHLVVDDKKWLHLKWLWNRFDEIDQALLSSRVLRECTNFDAYFQLVHDLNE